MTAVTAVPALPALPALPAPLAAAAAGGAAPQIRRHAAAAQLSGQPAPASVLGVISGAGAPLAAGVQHDMGQRFGHDFSQVKVHTDAAAAQSAQEVQARAYTVGQHVVFGAGQFAPASSDGRRLLAHELTHVLQQGAADGTSGATGVLARAPAPAATIGTKFVPPAGKTSPFTSVKAQFDGQDFTVRDGATVIMSQPAQSGKPIPVRAGDASACGGAVSDAYLNNPLYLGIEDFGPIPEGEFSVSLAEFSTFGMWERAQMITGGTYVDPFGASLHGGDWGTGRAPLHPKTLLPATARCGDTSRRSGFYLHGGSLPGSSGCIDIANQGIDTFLAQLGGYKAAIPVSVRYTHAAPAVGAGTRGVGRFTYPTRDGKPIKDPTIWDRFKSIGGADAGPAAPPATPKAGPKPAPKPAPKAAPKAGPKAAPKPPNKLRPKPRRGGGRGHAGLMELAPAQQWAASVDDSDSADDESADV